MDRSSADKPSAVSEMEAVPIIRVCHVRLMFAIMNMLWEAISKVANVLQVTVWNVNRLHYYWCKRYRTTVIGRDLS